MSRRQQILLLHSPAEGSFRNTKNRKTHPPTPEVTQKYTGFSQVNRKKISKLSRKCNKKPVTFLTKKAIFCTKRGAKMAILRQFARTVLPLFAP
jgi:hypothetical protein